MELIKKWEKKYSELNTEYSQTKEMMTEREIYEVISHLKSISSFIEDIQALRQPPVSGELADFARFLSEEYSIEIHERIIDEWNKYYSANYR